VKGKNHDLKHDLTFSAHTINCVCHSIRAIFRVLGIYNFGLDKRKASFKELMGFFVQPLKQQMKSLQ
jgi:hypothetical protein